VIFAAGFFIGTAATLAIVYVSDAFGVRKMRRQFEAANRRFDQAIDELVGVGWREPKERGDA